MVWLHFYQCSLYKVFYICCLKESTKKNHECLPYIFNAVVTAVISHMWQCMCLMGNKTPFFFCSRTGESDEREQSKLEVKVWDPNSPLTDRQIDQFLVVARWVWHYWVKISFLSIKEFTHIIFSLYSAFFIGCIFF